MKTKAENRQWSDTSSNILKNKEKSTTTYRGDRTAWLDDSQGKDEEDIGKVYQKRKEEIKEMRENNSKRRAKGEDKTQTNLDESQEEYRLEEEARRSRAQAARQREKGHKMATPGKVCGQQRST